MRVDKEALGISIVQHALLLFHQRQVSYFFDSYLIPIDTLYISLILLKCLHSNGSLTHIIMFHSASTSLAVEVPSLPELSFTGLVKVCFITI